MQVTVTLTVKESQALRMATCFGAPSPWPDVLQSAYGKLLAAERAAGHNV